MGGLFYAPVAQWLEHPTHNRQVVGSSPTRRTNRITMKRIIKYLISLGEHQIKASIYCGHPGPLM